MFKIVDVKQAALTEIVTQLVALPLASREDVVRIKAKVCKKYKLEQTIRNSEILDVMPAHASSRLLEALRIRRVRSLSGVSVVAVMTKPSWCPHGTCVYCPGGPLLNSPKSYTGFEPAARRAKQNEFDSFKQVRTRLAQLRAIGHEPQKCEVIVMGGTFNAQSKDYQDAFVKGLYDAFNGENSVAVQQAKELNESAPYRVVGLTFETKPDWATPKEIDALLEYGATRLELGIQSLDEEVLRRAHRGHSLRQSEEATRFAKDAFFKVCFHMMPGLFSTPQKDIRYFEELFASPRWKPDMLKIYPCLVVPGTELYESWRRGTFVPYNSDQAAEVIAEGKRFVPEYCRIMRIDRDIPTTLIAAGVEKSNLRELVCQKLKRKGARCHCIRCREAGLQSREGREIDWSGLEMKRLDYKASGGKEVFVSFESNDMLLGFLRLRLPGQPWRPEITSETAGVRELHVYGEQLPLHSRKEAVQHRSLGKCLLAEAERIAKEEWGCRKLLIISGVGVREYYAKLGYQRDGVYMGKVLS